MIIGILGHAARFAVFAFLPQYLESSSLINVLHGICYAFFFATVYIFVDEFFPKDVRSSAQGLFNLMILGIRPAGREHPGPEADGETFNRRGRGLPQSVLVPAIAALAAAVILAVFFHPPAKRA